MKNSDGFGNRSRGRQEALAFTVLEVLIVVIVLGVLAAIVVPKFVGAASGAQEAAIRANIRSLNTQADVQFRMHRAHSAAEAEWLTTVPKLLATVKGDMYSDWTVNDGSLVAPTGMVFLLTAESASKPARLDEQAEGEVSEEETAEPTPTPEPEEEEDELTDEELQSLSSEELLAANLTPEQMAKLTPEQLAELSALELSRFTEEQLQALTAEQIAALSLSQFSAVAAMLTPEQISQARPQQIAALSDDVYSSLSDEQRAAVTEEQLAEREIADAVRQLPYSQIRNLDPSQVPYLTAEQIAAIPSSYEMSRIPEEVRAAFTEEQLQALNTANVSIGYLTEEQRDYLTADQYAAIGRYTDIRYVPPSRVPELSTDLIASIPSSYEMSRYSEEIRAAMTAEQIQAINTDNVSISYLTEAQRLQLTEAQYEAIDRYTDIRYVPPSRVPELSTDLIASIPSSYEMSRYSDEVRAAFSTEQLQAINTEAVSIGYLTEAQRELLTADQYASIARYTDICYTPVDRVGDLSTAVIASIPSDYEMSRSSAEIRAAFTAEQVQALNTEVVSIGYITEAQRELLTADQYASITRYTDIRYTPVDRVGDLSTAVISSIPSNYEMSRFSEEIRAAFTEEQVQAINTSNVSLSYLTTAQTEQLTTSQIESIKSYTEMRYLPPSRIAEVTTETISQMTSTYEISRIPTENMQALTQAQVLAIPDSVYDSIKSRLTAEQLSWRP